MNTKDLEGKTIKTIEEPRELNVEGFVQSDRNFLITFTDGTVWKMASWDHEGYRSGIYTEIVPCDTPPLPTDVEGEIRAIWDTPMMREEHPSLESRIQETFTVLHRSRIADREELRNAVEGMRKAHPDKNDPDMYEACYAVAGFNDALNKVTRLLTSKDT